MNVEQVRVVVCGATLRGRVIRDSVFAHFSVVQDRNTVLFSFPAGEDCSEAVGNRPRQLPSNPDGQHDTQAKDVRGVLGPRLRAR